MSDANESVIFTIENNIANITINRPEKRNAIDPNLIKTLDNILDKVNVDKSIRVVVLKGEGEHFCAGADLGWMKSMADAGESENYEDALVLAKMLHKLNNLNKPLIGVIQGAAFGGAVGIAACCDVTIALNDAKFCLSEVKLGLSPAVISPFVVAAIGEKQSRRYMLTAEIFDAKTAYELGLVNILVTKDNVEQELNKIISIFLQNAPNAVSSTKKLIANVKNNNFGSYTNIEEYTASVIADIRTTSEAQEGTKSFLESENRIGLNSKSKYFLRTLLVNIILTSEKYFAFQA